jgi:NAD(P)-dependent dehydrogenase (short-subunit alcohol dehydrogenase family)
MTGPSAPRLEGRVAIVTGGASGMGLGMVRRFLAEGAAVVVADLNPATGAEAVAELAGVHGDRVRFQQVDVAVEEDVAGVVAAAVAAYGQLDVMCNNAGVGGAFGAVTDLHVDDWDYTFDVLVRGVFLGVKHAARQMVAQGWGGSIINTGSIAGLSGGAGPLCYSAAKAAVVNLTRAAAVELAPQRIRVNAINPGVIMTPLLLGGRPDRAGVVAEQVAPFVPWPELGQPEHIAGVALFLASDDAEYVTGEAVVVDGGTVAAGPGLATRPEAGAVPSGFVGANRGTTGQPSVVRRRPAG